MKKSGGILKNVSNLTNVYQAWKASKYYEKPIKHGLFNEF